MSSYEIVTLTAQNVAPIRALSFSDGAKSTGGLREGDNDLKTLHIGVRVNSETVSVGTINHDPSPRNPYTPVWRIRGMATLKEHRNKNYGSAILRHIIEYIASNGGGLLWGNLRLAAVHFYERHGFIAHEDIFQTAGRIDHRYGELLISPT